MGRRKNSDHACVWVRQSLQKMVDVMRKETVRAK